MKILLLAFICALSISAEARLAEDKSNLLTAMDLGTKSSIKVEKGSEMVMNNALKENPKKIYELTFVCRKKTSGLFCKPSSLR